jgi:hypothetical protein
MVKMTPEEWRRVGEAIVIWCGWGRESYPSRNDNSLVEHFGSQVATTLLPLIRELEDDFYSSDARYTTADVAEMASISVAQFMRKHPEIPEEAARALAWCYTFDYK